MRLLVGRKWWVLLGQIHTHDSYTAGLRKVKREEMTHKNPALRKTGPVPDKAKPGGGAKPAPAAKPAAKKPPVFELQNKKWAVVCTVSL